MKINVRQIEKKDLDALAEIYVKAYAKINIGEIWTTSTAKNAVLLVR